MDMRSLNYSRNTTRETNRREPVRGKPSFTQKEGKMEDQRVSICSDCKRGIFKTQERIWTNRGLVHTECENDEVIIIT